MCSNPGVNPMGLGSPQRPLEPRLSIAQKKGTVYCDVYKSITNNLPKMFLGIKPMDLGAPWTES